MDRKKPNVIFMYILGALITLSFFSIIILHSLRLIPPGNETMVNISIGQLSSAFIMVVSYFYGSSAGSANKTDMMTKQAGEAVK
jgi:hypothetical protein